MEGDHKSEHMVRYSSMLSAVAIAAVLVSAILLAIADALVKKIAISGSFFSAVFNPWMLLICVLYFLQILLVLYVFIHKGDLAIYAIVFVVFYAVLMVLLGVFVFDEHLSMLQCIGIALALTGAALLNSGL